VQNPKPHHFKPFEFFDHTGTIDADIQGTANATKRLGASTEYWQRSLSRPVRIGGADFWQCPLWRPRAGRNDEQFYTLPARGESLKRFEKCDQGRKVLFSHVHRLHSAVCHCVGGLLQNAPQLCGVMLLSNSEQ
jgi:hypothetical protein